MSILEWFFSDRVVACHILRICVSSKFSSKLVENWEGNGNPLQHSCLENPRDTGAWWAAVYATQLKRISSSSSSSEEYHAQRFLGWSHLFSSVLSFFPLFLAFIAATEKSDTKLLFFLKSFHCYCKLIHFPLLFRVQKFYQDIPRYMWFFFFFFQSFLPGSQQGLLIYWFKSFFSLGEISSHSSSFSSSLNYRLSSIYSFNFFWNSH